MSSMQHPVDPTIQTAPAELGYRPRVLIAEDDELVREQLQTLLEEDLNLQIDVAPNGQQALEALKREFYSVFLTDLKMPRMEGMELIQRIREEDIPVSVIVMTGHGSIEGVVQAMKAGASDYLTKPLDLDYLQLVIQRALKERALQDELVYLRERLMARDAFAAIITKSPKMHAVLELINNLAHVTTTVLIEGETGTGKEMVASAIHQASQPHRSGNLVPVNCAALPKELIESELFGHEKGAFTGAIGQRTGRFEQAHGGTLFLDEIGEIPLEMQVKLLRAIQERKFERVGGSQSIEVDVRIVAATNKSLARMVKKGKFREDLYYRVNVVRLELPPLRDRPEDIPLLVNHFCRKFAVQADEPKTFSGKAMDVLLNHAWPGNVRELENVIERLCVTTSGSVIEDVSQDLFQSVRERSPFRVDLSRELPEQLREITSSFEKRYITKALAKTRGNVGRCAKICGLSRRSITAKLSEYDINKDEMKDL